MSWWTRHRQVGRGFGRINVGDLFLDAGIGVATFNYYGELDPDTPTGFSARDSREVHEARDRPGEDDRAADAWGSICGVGVGHEPGRGLLRDGQG
jgi:hypothetical protein